MKFVNKSKYALYVGILLVLVMVVSAETLHISQGASSGRANTDAELILEDDDVVVIQLLTPANQDGVLAFGDTGDTTAGEVRYSHTTDSLKFRTAGTSNRMIIDSNGNVGIGSSPLTVYRDFGAVSVVNPATVPLFVSSQDDSFVTVYTSNETNNSGIAFARWETPANKAVEKWRIYNKGTTGSATDDALYILSQDGNGLILSQGDISSFSGNELRLNARLSQGLSSSYPAYGFYLFTGISGAPTMTGTDQVGMFVDMHGSSEATSQVIGSQFRAGTTNAAFNTALAISVKAMNPEKGSGSTITKAVGLRIDSITAGETNYAIETLGTAPSVFGGNVGIGTTNPKSRLHLEGGDITLSTEGSGIILKSTNGPCFKVTVNESGTLITTPLESC